jgi:hypothetical protein
MFVNSTNVKSLKLSFLNQICSYGWNIRKQRNLNQLNKLFKILIQTHPCKKTPSIINISGLRKAIEMKISPSKNARRGNEDNKKENSLKEEKV